MRIEPPPSVPWTAGTSPAATAAAARPDHAAPANHVGIAQAEEGEAGFRQDGAGHHDRCGHRHRRQRVGQDVHQDDAQVRHARVDVGQHELGVAQPQHLRPHQPRQTGPCGEADGDHDAADRRLQDGDDDDGEQEGRDGLEQLGHRHQGAVGDAAEIAGQRAHRDADHNGDQRRHRADQQRDPRAVEQVGRHVAADHVAAQREGGVLTRPQEGRRHQIQRVVGVEQTGRGGGHDDGRQDQQAGAGRGGAGDAGEGHLNAPRCAGRGRNRGGPRRGSPRRRTGASAGSARRWR